MEPKSTKSLALAGRFFLSLHHLGSPSKEDRHPNPQCRSGVANNNRCPYAGCIICTTLYEELHSLSLFNIWHKTGRQPPKNWYFWIVVLEKTLENPLDSKEIKPINCKGNQPWIVIGRTDAEAEAPMFGHLMLSRLIGKDPNAGKDWGQKAKGTTEDEMVG